MMGELVNNGLERIWKEAAWPNLGCYTGNYLEGLRRKTDILRQDSRSQER
jgi:hypothetical protein